MLGRWLLACALLGCSSDDTTPKDAGADTEASTDAGYPGPHPAPPQVVNHQGPVLATPNIVPVFFANDAYQGQVEDFLKQLAGSTYWTKTTSEYGVGAMTAGTSIVTTDAPPQTIDTAGIETFLTKQTAGPNDVFAVFYPSTTTVSDPLFGTSCTDFNGFHYQGIKNGSLVYVIIPRCPSAGTLTGFDAISAAFSHELVEAATDPFLDTTPGWAYTDVDHLIWSFVPGAEVADMCELEPQSFMPLVGSYVVQRSWSNASALAGHDPCVPALSPYFVAAPVLNTKVQITFQGQPTTTNGIQIVVGDTKTIPVQLISDAPTSDWSVGAIDVKSPSGFTFVWDKQTGNNGDTLHLSITRNLGTSSEFAIASTVGTTTNLWFGFVSD
jgi:hypothetical protein